MELKSFDDLKKILNDKLNNNILRAGLPIIIYGIEKQLIKDSIKLIYSIVNVLPELNIVTLEDSFVSYDEVVNACETLPIMSDIRIVHIKNPYFLKKANSDSEDVKRQAVLSSESDGLVDYIKNLVKSMPENILLLISHEDEIENKNKLLSSIKNNGFTLEFKMLKGEELYSYIAGTFERKGKKISRSDILYFAGLLGNSMEQMEIEIEKLLAYAMEEEHVTRIHIDDIVHKSIENNIFKMVDSISVKNAETAISILDALLFQKEEPLRILGMIIRQYRLLYLVNLMIEQSKSFEEIKSSLKEKKIILMDFVINNLIKQSRNFESGVLRKALTLCLNADENIKSNRLTPELVLETLIVQLCR